MIKILVVMLFAIASLWSPTASAASASFAATLGSGASFAAWCVGGTGGTCSGGVFWPSTVIANSSGTEIFTTANPGYFDIPSATPASTNLGTILALPPTLTYQATWGSACSYSSGNNAWCGDPKGAAFFDLGAVNGAAIALGQTTMAASLPVAIASNQSAVPVNNSQIGGAAVVADPCQQTAKLTVSINQTSNTQIFAGTASKKTYVCHIHIVTATAQNVALVEGTGTVCATNIYGLAGGTTAATGWNFSANSGIALGSGLASVITPSGDTNATAANVCILQSGSGQLSGVITYVQI